MVEEHTALVQDVPIRIAIVEEQGLLRTLLASVLGREPGFEVVCAHADLTTARVALTDIAFDVVLWGTAPRRWNAAQVFTDLRQTLPGIGIVFMVSLSDPWYHLALPRNLDEGWSVVLKDTFEDLATLDRVVRGSAQGMVVLDPRVISGLNAWKTRVDRLDERSFEILRLVAEGFSNPAIADRTGLAAKSVENRLGAIYQRLGIDTADSSKHPRVRASLEFYGRQSANGL